MELLNVNWPGWETVKLIGRGSFGSVYEIERDLFGNIEKAALKVISIPQNDVDIEELRSDGYDDKSIISAFQSSLQSIVAEYILMRKMSGCSNIVNCDDIRYIQHEDGFGWDIFIKMELLTPLARALPEIIPEDMVIKIAYDMCTALELCNRYHIVHRDMKPQNIFVSPNGDYKLGDFGIAKTVEKTSGGTKIGTYKYMAPEVYYYKPYNATADIYSLGLVLYWLLNDRRMPFLPLPPEKLTVKTEETAKERRLSGEKIPLPAHGSLELKQIVLKACAFDPQNRFQSAKEMKKALCDLWIGAEKPIDVKSLPLVREAKNEDSGQRSVCPSGVVGAQHAPEVEVKNNQTAPMVEQSGTRKKEQKPMDVQKALSYFHKEMDEYEQPSGNRQERLAAMRRAEEEESRRKIAEEEENQRKEKQKAWADMIRMFRE